MQYFCSKNSLILFAEVKQKKLKKMQNFKVAMFVLQQQKPGSNLSKHQKEQIQNRSNQELKDAFSLVTSKSSYNLSIWEKLRLDRFFRFIIEGEIAPETFKTELKLEIIPVTTEIEF